MELALYSQQQDDFPRQEKEGEFLQVSQLRHGAVDRSWDGIPRVEGTSGGTTGAGRTQERPGVPNQRGTEIKEIILFDKAQTGAPGASPDSVIG